MNNKASITALMSSFGRAFHAENEKHPVFKDNLAGKLMIAEEYAAVKGYIFSGGNSLNRIQTLKSKIRQSFYAD